MDGTEPTIHSEKTEPPPSYTKLSFMCTRVVCVMQSQQDSRNQNISGIRFKGRGRVLLPDPARMKNHIL